MKSNFKQHVVNVTTKAREQTKQESQASRYRVVNCFRSLEPNDHQELKDKEMTVIDVEENPTEKSDAATTEAIFHNYTIENNVFFSSYDLLLRFRTILD